MRVLLIDIGNSRVKWRLVDPRLDWPQDVVAQLVVDPEDAGASNRYGSLALVDLQQLAERFRASREPALDAVHLSNVAGAEAEDALRGAVRSSWGDVPVHALIPNAAQCGVRNGYRDKSQLGPDRWAAMLGAHALVPDMHVLVCSFGTAATIDLLFYEGDKATHASFAGGLILPGTEAMRRALARDTARLPLAQGEVVDFAIGTEDAIASGIAAAQAGAVMRALRDARVRAASRDREIGASGKSGAEHPFACVLAGGDANAMAAYLSDFQATMHIVPDLVLHGLHAIARDELKQREQSHDAGRIHPRIDSSKLVREHP